MYAFLILLTISLPNGEVGKFRIWSRGSFGQLTCLKRADAYADRLIDYSKQRAPYAVVRTESSCELQITRPA